MKSPFSSTSKQKSSQLEKKIARLENELEFVDILAQFWPWENMTHRALRLQSCLNALKSEKNGSFPAQPVTIEKRQALNCQ